MARIGSTSRLATKKRRPSIVPAFGRALEHLRHRLKYGVSGKPVPRVTVCQQVTKSLERKKIDSRVGIKETTLHRWEKGETISVDPLILKELADLYGASYMALLALLEDNLRNSSLAVPDVASLMINSTHGQLPQAGVEQVSTVAVTGDSSDATRSVHRTVIDLREELANAIRAAEEQTKRALAVLTAAAELAARPGVLEEPKVARGQAPTRH
jgi:hypothetical protein